MFGIFFVASYRRNLTQGSPPARNYYWSIAPASHSRNLAHRGSSNVVHRYFYSMNHWSQCGCELDFHKRARSRNIHLHGHAHHNHNRHRHLSRKSLSHGHARRRDRLDHSSQVHVHALYTQRRGHISCHGRCCHNWCCVSMYSTGSHALRTHRYTWGRVLNVPGMTLVQDSHCRSRNRR